MKYSILFIICLTGLLNAASKPAYEIEDIKLPKGVDPQIGALTFMPDGRLLVGFNYGKVFTYTPETKEWKLFAEGLHLPLGAVALNDREVLIMQRPELTKLIDRDGDGDADTYEKAYDSFGLSGNYHEFAFGPTRDAQGNLFIGLNVASNNGGILSEVRGEFKSFDITQKKLSGEFDKEKISRMYSCVPYRGWIIKILPDGTAIPFASGVRSPNGLGFDHKGRLLVSDNQGDWLGTSKLHHVEKGDFLGHPASLVWKKGVDKNPMSIPVEELNKMRKKAAGLFPQGIIANSPTQPLLDSTNGKFGPFANQMFIGEMNLAHLVRFIPDEVQGTLQGTMVPFMNDTPLRNGNNRLAFGKEGSLWVGKMHLSWPGDEGLKRIKWTGKNPFDVQSVKLTPKGFELNLTQALNKTQMKTFPKCKVKSYFYSYHKDYGSKRMEEKEVSITSANVDSDGKKILLEIDKIEEGRVYQFELNELENEDNQKLSSTLLCYNLIKKCVTKDNKSKN